MDNQYWSWLLGAVGVVGFVLAGRRVWWSWYVNLGCQGIWFAYAFVTQQYGFIATALVYTVVFGKNAISWTKEHNTKTKVRQPSILDIAEQAMAEAERGIITKEQAQEVMLDICRGNRGVKEEKARRQPGS